MSSMARQSSFGCDIFSAVESPSGSMESVPPSTGFANVGKLDETDDSGVPVAMDDVDELRCGSSKLNGGGENGIWNF